MLATKISIKFQQDWSGLIAKYEHLKQLLNNNPNAKGKWIEAYKANRYDFGASGSYLSFDSITEQPGMASTINGQIVEDLLPWIDQLKSDLSELSVANIGFQGNNGPLKRHTDGKVDSSLVGHCKLNYCINNYDAISYVQRDDVVETYPSVKDGAYLLDTTAEHWVEAVGQRYLFQISFDDPFEKVLAWFEQHPNLVYGK